MTDETTSAETAGNVAAATTEAATTTTSQETTAASWRDSLPDDIKTAPSLAKFETIEGLAKSYTNLEKMLGADKIVVPKEGDEEGWNRAYAALGRPEKPEEYGFKAPEQIPEGMQYNEELDQQLAGIFHKRGLNKAQAAAVRQDLMDIVGKGALDSLEASKAAEAAKQAEVQEAERALKAEWGSAFEQRAQVAGAAINKFAPPEAIAVMESAGLANNPAVVKMFYDIGVKLAGEKALIGASEQSQSPADLDSAIASFRETHSTALFDRSHPDHAQRTKEFTALFEKRFPQQAA